MPKNERIQPLPVEDFERYCEALAHQILDGGIKYSWVIIIMNGAHAVWSYLREVIPHGHVYEVLATHYPDGEQHPSGPVEIRNFPKQLSGIGLVLDDCVDSADAMFETISYALSAGARRVDSAAVLYKPSNVAIRDPDTGQKFRPTFIGWDSAPGDVFYDFPREAFKKRILAARSSTTPSVAEQTPA